jgi:hypothetical protein
MVLGIRRHNPAALLAGKRPGNHSTGDWVGPRAGLDGYKKSRPRRDSILPNVQPVASRYINYIIPAHTQLDDTCVEETQR